MCELILVTILAGGIMGVVKQLGGNTSAADLEKLNGEIRDLEGMLKDLPEETEARTAAVNAPIPNVVKTEAEEERKRQHELRKHH